MSETQMIEERLHDLFAAPDDADWQDVLSRAGDTRPQAPLVKRRRMIAVVAAAVIGLAIAVPASGLPGTVINWFEAPTAPGPTQKDFTSLDVGAPKGMSPHVSGPARSVMEVRISGEDSPLWVAPTANGGFCLELDFGEGCDRDRQLPLQVTVEQRNAQTPPVVFGDVLSSEVDHVELLYPSGKKVSLPVVSVSAPINASFFGYQSPGSGAHPEGWPTAVEALRADGTVIASTTLHGGFPPRP